MQLIIKDGKVIAEHEDHQVVSDKYPNTECISWQDPLPSLGPEDPLHDDPRSQSQKDEYYKDKRRVAYPRIQDQLDMLYHDTVNGTTVWVDAISNVKTTFPKPLEVEK